MPRYINADEFYEAKLKTEKIAMLKELQSEIEELDSRAGYDGNGMPTFSTDYIRKKKVNELIQQKIDKLKGEINTDAEKYIQARLEFIRRNSTYGLNFGKDYERLEQEFHCGIEESGFHAYNCNDCPNKCEEWYQWDKEMKNDGLQ